ncbi:hypothetical protein [Pseudomonas putida]|uniref:hypothetical protein n=1 Tax=Pseudomonas putida TaxID=303 RepID=UPI0013A699EB|nr:hypothetical protein [Pseudomonas putida]
MRIVLSISFDQFPQFGAQPECPPSVLDIPGFLTAFTPGLSFILPAFRVALGVGRSTILIGLARILTGFLPGIARGAALFGAIGGGPGCTVHQQQKNHRQPNRHPWHFHDSISHEPGISVQLIFRLSAG